MKVVCQINQLWQSHHTPTILNCHPFLWSLLPPWFSQTVLQVLTRVGFESSTYILLKQCAYLCNIFCQKLVLSATPEGFCEFIFHFKTKFYVFLKFHISEFVKVFKEKYNRQFRRFTYAMNNAFVTNEIEMLKYHIE